MALPVSAGYQAQIDNISNQIAGQAGIFNPRRRRSASDYLAQLEDAGYSWGGSLDPKTEDGSTSYGLTIGRDGTAYGNATRSINDSMGARGAFYSSWNLRAQRDQRAALDAARNAIIRQSDTSQHQLTDQQADQDRQLRADLAEANGQYADWQAAQPVPAPAATPAADAGAGSPASTPAPGTLATPTSQPGTYRTWTGSAPPKLSTLAKAWGVPVGSIRVSVVNGKYTAWPQAAPPGHPA